MREKENPYPPAGARTTAGSGEAASSRREDQGEPPEQKPSRKLARTLIEFIVVLAGAVLIAYSIQALLVKPFEIPSGSMEKTLEVGDRVLVNRQAYRFSSVKRGDIIVFNSPVQAGTDLIKRVIAVGGDTIRIDEGQVFLNGRPQVESYVNGKDMSSFPPQTVPRGYVFVMGDNRPNSFDSRYWPSPWLPENSIIGKAFMIYWPLDRITWLG
ncbi:MAG: signal peptidase I [Actinobacteria bacterium]|nr:signal peptidase I [Actinomycetota bacterium]